MRPERHLWSAMMAIGIVLAPAIAAAQLQTETPAPVAGARPVTVERIKVHGAALEGNLEGNAPDRDVLVFLPPSYVKEKSRRYPVVYALHGYSIGAEQWSKEHRDSHEQGRRSLPEPRVAILQPHVVRRSSMPLAPWRD